MFRGQASRRQSYVLALLLLITAVPALSQGTRPPKDNDAGESDRPAERERYFRRGRTAPRQSAAALRYRAYQDKLTRRPARNASSPSPRSLSSRSSTPATPVPAGHPWIPLGPAPIGVDSTSGQNFGVNSGRVTSLAVDQSDATGNTVYAGAAYGGLWRSTNAANPDPAAVQWTPLLDDQPTLAVGAIALKPGDSNTILVGTGEANNSGDSYYGLGILRSTDGGATWNLVTATSDGSRSFKGLAFSKIAFSTDSPNLVVAATANSNAGVLGIDTSGIRGIYYSTDSGASWQYASVQDNGATITPASTSSVVYHPGLHKFFAAVRYHGFYSSIDGAHWTRLPVQPIAALTAAACPSSVSFGCPIMRGEISIQPVSGDIYTWFIDGSNTDRGVYRSTDGGSSWTSLGSSGIDTCGDSQGCGTSDQGDYDLEIAAVPNGAGTDLYAGAINIYKCSLAGSSSTCSTWLNLTHVYGCTVWGQPAHVHPDQHGVDFSRANPNLIYFGHDGGVSRALNGPGLLGGACSSANAFDNLSGTLGSLTEFVSFSEHPTDDTTLLGGAQDVGSAAVDSTHPGLGTLAWMNVNAGDGGFNAINPSNPLEWFTAYTDVSIQRCTGGITCNAGTFGNVVTNSQVGGDHGDFYTPYILDPGMPSKIIVGTCRVWRGNSDGTGWTSSNALSYNFTTLTTATCSGSDANLVSALAAGGPVDTVTHTGSSVIYAGTNAGNVFVTFKAPQGPPYWYSQGYAQGVFGGDKISDIAIDPGDPTGQTAYATVMGFGTPHVYKTSTNPMYWVPISGDLPDAPADSVAVDPNDSSVIYVGTDVGVFVTTNGGVNWTEWGAGLPSIPVTRIRTFVSPDHAVNKLRVSTYGRGMWQTDLLTGLPFRMSIASPSLSVTPSQTATITVSLTPQAGFTGTVTLSCEPSGATLPATCQGGVADLSAGPVQFTVTASDPGTGTFSFLIQGVASDASATTLQLPVTLAVSDFVLALVGTSPSPFTIGHSASGNFTFSISALGPFSGTVALACLGAPAGVTCTPGQNSANLSPANTFHIPVSVSVASNAPVGNYTLTVQGIGSSATHTLAIPLTVTTNPIFVMSAGASVSVVATATAHQTVTLTSQDGYAGTVKLTANGATVVPSTVSTFPVTVDVTIPTTASIEGPRTVTVTGADASDAAKTNSVNVPFTVMYYRAGSALVANGASAFLFPGQAGSFSVNFSVQGQYGYTGTVALNGCASTPGAAISCTFIPPGPLTIGPAATSVTATVNVPAISTPGYYQLSFSMSDVNFPGLDPGTGTSFAVEDFQLTSPIGTSLTTRAGTPVSLPIYANNPADGSLFVGSVTFDPQTACSGLPALASCSFSNNSAGPTGPAYLTISTALAHAETHPPAWRHRLPFYAFFLSLPATLGLLALPRDSKRRRKWLAFVALALMLYLSLVAVGCGGASGGSAFSGDSTSSPGTPAGTYNVTITGKSTNAGLTVSHSIQLTLTVQ